MPAQPNRPQPLNQTGRSRSTRAAQPKLGHRSASATYQEPNWRPPPHQTAHQQKGTTHMSSIINQTSCGHSAVIATTQPHTPPVDQAAHHPPTKQSTRPLPLQSTFTMCQPPRTPLETDHPTNQTDETNKLTTNPKLTDQPITALCATNCHATPSTTGPMNKGMPPPKQRNGLMNDQMVVTTPSAKHAA